jgi:hypothetical protein
MKPLSQIVVLTLSLLPTLGFAGEAGNSAESCFHLFLPGDEGRAELDQACFQHEPGAATGSIRLLLKNREVFAVDEVRVNEIPAHRPPITCHVDCPDRPSVFPAEDRYQAYSDNDTEILDIDVGIPEPRPSLTTDLGLIYFHGKNYQVVSPSDL